MRRLKRGLALVLTLCMLLSIVPVITPSVNAADTTTDDFYRIVHLDCGRKYFTANWIKSLIDHMAEVGYNQLQLAFGNDGLRFVLDDMSFSANGTEYTHASVVSAIESGNASQNSSGDTSYLTETEMDEIIAYANSKGIEIVPLMNLPGHANTILDIAGDAYNYSPSQNTLDVTNEEAVNFAMAIFQKYVDYFAAKGCKFFNFGADEFANDISSGSFSFGMLSSSQYNSFVSFINDMAAYIEGKGMTPRAFNDGLYYGRYSNVSIDTNIQCCYWSSGWSGYDVASAATIANKGHEMINTHGDFYYVLGKNDKFDSGNSYASNWDNTTFPGGTVSNPAGAMFCIWCDYPNAETEAQIYNNVVTGEILSAMSQAMGYTPEETEPDPEPVTVTDDTYGVSVTAPGLEKVEVTSGEAVTNEDGTVSKTYTITLNDGKYTEGATVKIPYDKAFDGCVAFSGKVDGEPFDVRLEGDYFVAEVPHFSTLTIEGKAIVSETVNLEVDQVYPKTIPGVNYSEQVDRTELNEEIATVVVDGTDAVEATTNYIEASSVTCNTLLGDDSDNWTAASGYYYTPDGTNYYPVYAKRSWSISWGRFSYTYTWGYSTTSSTSNVTQIGTQNTSSSRTAPNITVYTQSTTDPVDASTTITFTGVFPGTTYVTVGDTRYTIHVAYKQATINVVLDGTKTVSVSGDLDASNLNTSIATVSVENGVMTVTGTGEGETTVTVGDTIYTIKVAKEDLSAVTALTLEYWITNGRPTDSDGNKSVSVAAADAYLADGISVTELAPANTIKETRTLEYWRCRLLDKTKTNSSGNGTEEQTEDAGDDETYSGVGFTKVRYWNGTWEVFTEKNEWVSVTDNHQLVAYYLEILPVADELTVTAADWGKKGDGSTSGDYLEPSSSCTVSVQVVYEDGTTNPASTTAADLKSSTIAYGYWSGGRGIGTLNLIGLEGYQIWKIEAETGSETYINSSAWGGFTVNSFTWDNNPMTVYEGDPVDSYVIHNDSHNPTKDGYYENLMWDENYEAILIKVYVKAAATEDSLAVHYIDQTANQEFYSYNIAVRAGIYFNEEIGLDTPWKGALKNGTVTNIWNVQQTVSADLSTMPAIGVQYRFSDYTCVKVERINDGKDVYLYYTFNNAHSFVVDFGLPVKITPNDIRISGDWTSANVTGAKYGTATATVGEGLTYTPNQVITGVESLQLTLIGQTEAESVTHQIYLYPATTVYYEEGFATYTGSWKDKVENGAPYVPNTGKGTQTASAAGSKANYGYDAKYAGTEDSDEIGPSDGTEAVSKVNNNDRAEFTFTGTGVDIYANCTDDTGAIMMELSKRDANGEYQMKRIIAVDTRMQNGTQEGTQGQAVDGYNIPIVSLTKLEYGDYRLRIAHVKAGSDEASRIDGVKLDGFRVYGTLNDADLHDSEKNGVYYQDQEDKPTFLDMRDEVLTAKNVVGLEGGYATKVAEQVYSSSKLTEGGAIILSNNENVLSDENLLDYLKNGPKNELYLRKGQSLVFNIATNRKVQIGLKALNADTKYTINNGTEQTLSSSTDMFYTLQNKGGTGGTFTITNTGSGILSITKLKISDDPDAALGQLTQEDLVKALVSLGFEESAATRFDDITESKWYYNAVEFVTGRGYFVGVADNLFGPDQTMTRGMFVTVLGRAAKVNKADYADADTGFTDVKSGAYYAPYVAWAKENGIVYGKTETEFCPDMTVTREEMAAFMCRFARYLGLDTTVKDSSWMDRYTDAGAISAYARNSIGWCVEAGIITGTSSTTVSPKDLATRAQVATVIKNLVQKVIERK